MATKSWDGAAFGSQSTRFNLNGLHPNLYTTGKMPYDPNVTSKKVVSETKKNDLIGREKINHFFLSYSTKYTKYMILQSLKGYAKKKFSNIN